MPQFSAVYGQDFGSTSSFTDQYRENSDLFNTDPESTSDTLAGDKEKKPKKPLESYYFGDSLKVRNVFAWQYDNRRNDIKEIAIDTALNNFQKDYPYISSEKVGSAYLGNSGGAAIPIDYFNRASANESFSLVNAFTQYIYTPDNVPFYNGKRPFSQLAYFMSGQSSKLEQQLRVTHAQNISPSSGINITYRSVGTKGAYTNQTSNQKNLSTAFNHTGKQYSIHGGYIYNMGDMRENGGMVDDREVTDTIIDLPENIQMQLEDARNRFRGNTFYYTQAYAVPFSRFSDDTGETAADKTSLYIGQGMNYTSFNKVYTDTKAYSGDFYDNWYLDSVESRDSLRESRLDINAFVQLQPYSRDGVLGLLTGGVGYLTESYYYFSPDQYVTSPHETTTEGSLYLYGSLSGKIGRFLDWGADINYTPIGYRSGDVDLKADLSLSPRIGSRPVIVDFDLLIRNETPSYWSEHYYSNHFSWNNSFGKETETRFGATLSIPDFGIELGATQSILGNKVYYDAQSLPQQCSDIVSISGIYLQKDFQAGGFHFNHRAKLQWSTDQEVVPVPLATANLLYYFEFNVVKDVLRMQLGFDGYYNTEYYGFGYNPAIAQFYNQREVEIGNYPVIDGYISGKWKRVRFLVKYQHANYNLFGDNNYFTVAHYPLNRSMFKLGISWNFYD